MSLIGADSWMPPTQQMLDALKLVHAFGFYGGYLPSAGVADGISWPASAWELLQNNGLRPLPIYVPKQDCSEDPLFVAHDAIVQLEAMGMTGAVAIDGEKSMSNILNFQNWLDTVFLNINKAGIHAINYAGHGYHTSNAFTWAVAWGENAEIPVAGEALQYGPYMLRTPTGQNLMEVDGDSADSSFPFANWITNPWPDTLEEDELPKPLLVTCKGKPDLLVYEGTVAPVSSQGSLDKFVELFGSITQNSQGGILQLECDTDPNQYESYARKT